MISKQTLKEIIVSNEEFILNGISDVVPRQGLQFPDALKKVMILYGVRRSRKTYVLFDLFKKRKNNALYMDFEDERLEDFETLKDAFLELKSG